MPVVLDTNIARGMGAGDVDSNGLTELRRAGIRIHLADGTMWELTYQLLTGAFPWSQWIAAREILCSLLDAEEPVLIGGRIGLHRAGLHGSRPYSEADSATSLALSNAGWRLLVETGSATELGEASITLPEQQMVVTLPLDHAKAIRARREAAWIRDFEEFRCQFVERSPELRSALPSRDMGAPLEVYVGVVAAKRDKSLRSTSGPRASARMDASLRVEGLLRLRYLRMREPYNPVGNANDSFDCELLQYLAYPAVVCTCDRRLIAKVIDSGSWQTKWIVHPDDLMKPAVRAEVEELPWPVEIA
jgi:hypothetical protein